MKTKVILLKIAILALVIACAVSCKKDQQLKKTELPTGVEGVWNGTLTSGSTTSNAIAVFTSSKVKIYIAYQQAVDTTMSPTYTGTYTVMGDSIHCIMAPDVYNFVQKDTGNWFPAGNNNAGLMTMSFPTTSSAIYGEYDLYKE